jgi:hypothetical protein
MGCVPYVYIDADDNKWYVATGQAEVGPFNKKEEAQRHLKLLGVDKEVRSWPFV